MSNPIAGGSGSSLPSQSGMANTMMLPILGSAALYDRYRHFHDAFPTHWMWDGFLWLTALALWGGGLWLAVRGLGWSREGEVFRVESGSWW